MAIATTATITVADLIAWDIDADHRPDVSMPDVAAISYTDVAAHGTCCVCGTPIVASFDGIGDDADDTRWHHMDVAAVVASMA